MFFCRDKVTKDSAPGAVIIHLLGGIHEIYFPYILMNPLVIVAPILGNMAAIFWFSVTDCGLAGRESLWWTLPYPHEPGLTADKDQGSFRPSGEICVYGMNCSNSRINCSAMGVKVWFLYFPEISVIMSLSDMEKHDILDNIPDGISRGRKNTGEL